MLQTLSILAGKTVSLISKLLNRSGSTWPGHAAFGLDSNIVKKLTRTNPKLRIVLVAGTNGKTTTSKMLSEILEANGKKVFRNEEGANLLNGIASSLISHSNLLGKINFDTAIFEVDENSLSIILENTKPYAVILLNLFRDQLDRYGEVNIIAEKWKKALENLPKETFLISNGDDPMLSYISAKSGTENYYFGLPKKINSSTGSDPLQSDVDFLYCPHCSTKLEFESRIYSHLGKFKCPKCNFTNPLIYSFDTLSNPLLGEYNRYNINAAALLLTEGFGVGLDAIEMSLQNFTPAFGRQEKIKYKNKDVFVMLSKNPASFNQSIQAILGKEKSPNVLLVLNDRIPDGRDVSWIWDIDTDELSRKASSITISGERCFDMGLRLKYSEGKFEIRENLEQAINYAISKLKTGHTLYILPTYSAMLDTRKILTGRSIL